MTKQRLPFFSWRVSIIWLYSPSQISTVIPVQTNSFLLVLSGGPCL